MIISVIFILGLFLEFCVFHKNLNEMSFKNILMENETDIEVLILGNSHTFFGINPQWLSYKSINVANKSRKIETDFLILKKNIHKFKKLKTVIVPISYYTLFTSELTVEEKRLYFNYYRLKEYKQNWYNNRISLHTPLYELVNDLKFISKFPSKLSYNGWRANNETYTFDKKIIAERIGDVDKKIKDVKAIKLNSCYLDSLVNLCEKFKVKLVLVIPPYHPDFYKYSFNKYDQKNEELLKSLAFKKCIIFDGKSLKINSSSFFENVDHLNKNGAFLFTKKIDSLLIKIN